MGHHEDGLVAARQKTLKPYYHFEVEMVGGLVENEEVRIGNKHLSQRHTLLLASGQLGDRLLHIGDAELGEYLLGFQSRVIIGINTGETSLKYRCTFGKTRLLTKKASANTITIYYGAGIKALVTRKHREKCRFACSILGYQTNALTL